MLSASNKKINMTELKIIALVLLTFAVVGTATWLYLSTRDDDDDDGGYGF